MTDIPPMAVNTATLIFTFGSDGEMTVSKGWLFSEELDDDIVNRAQLLIDGIIMAVEFDGDELMKKAAYGLMYEDMKQQEQMAVDAENAPTGENIVALARRKLQ